MFASNKLCVLIVLCSLVAAGLGQALAEQPNETQPVVRGVGWVPCDFSIPLKYSCFDCNMRLVCKPVGGVLKPCSVDKPFCNRGVCSEIPSEECN